MRLLLLTAATAAPAFAQDLAPNVPVGGDIDVCTRGLIVSSLRGRIDAVDNDHVRIVMTKAGSVVQIPWRNVERLEWSRGRSRMRGLAEGALYGVLFGASVALSNYPFGAPDSPARDTQIRRVFQLGTAIAVGSTLIGLATGVHKWNGAPIPRSTAGAIALDLAATDEVRVESTLGRLEARHATAGDSLRFLTSAGPVTLPWRNVGDLQIRAGRNRVVGILLGAGIGLGASAIAESFIDVSNAGFATSVAVGGAMGYRYLTPRGWKSVPIPSR